MTTPSQKPNQVESVPGLIFKKLKKINITIEEISTEED